MQIKVFELQAVGYLLKPVKKEQLIAALDKSTHLNRLQLASLHALDETRRAHICARTYKAVELVNVSNIRSLEQIKNMFRCVVLAERLSLTNRCAN